MAIGSVWADVPVVKGSDEYGIGADYITAKVNTEQNEALQSRDIYLLNKFKEYYDKAHIDNLFSKYSTNLDWKESLNTLDDILDKYPTDLNWQDDVNTYSDLFVMPTEDGAVVNVKDVQDKYYFVYFKPNENEEGYWKQIDPNEYNNNIVDELPVYKYIYLNGYWQELDLNDFTEEEITERFSDVGSVHSYDKIESTFPEPEDYWVVSVVDPNNDFLLKGQVEYYEDIATTFQNPQNNWLVEVVNPNNNCTYKYNETTGKWERYGEKFKPEDGWVINTKDTNYTYRYDEEDNTWIEISANAMPLATEENDGLLSKEDYAYLREIEGEILPNIYLAINELEKKMFPLGTIVPYAFDTNTPPPGFVFAEGLLLSRNDYPEMWAELYKEPENDDPGYNFTVDDSLRDQYPGKFTSGDGETTFRTPDLRGCFLRGLDLGKGYESYERQFGTFQNDSIAEHNYDIEVTGVGSIDEPAIENGRLVIAGTTQNAFSETALIHLHASSDAETRPKNIAVRFIVKVVPTENLPVMNPSSNPPSVVVPINADTLNNHTSSISATPGAIPVADNNGKLDNSWFNLDSIATDNFVLRNEVSRKDASPGESANLIPVLNDSGYADGWISTVTEEDVDKWIRFFSNENYDISEESYNDSSDLEKNFLSQKKFVKFLIGLKEFINTFRQDYTTNDITPTNERGYISNAERIKYSDKYTKNETYELLYNFLLSYIPLSDATTIPTAGKIPIALENGKLDPDWMSDLFLNKIGEDGTTGYAEVSESRDIHIRGGIVDNTLTGNVNIQGGGTYSSSSISPAKGVIAGYDAVENKGGNIELYAGAGGDNISSIGGSVIIQSGTGTAYDGTIDLNNIKINKNNTIYTNELAIRLQQNDGVNNTNYVELTNSGLSYIHDNLVNDSDDYEFTLNSDGTVTTNRPNVANGITLLNNRSLVPFDNLPKTVLVNNIGDFLQNQVINTNLGNVIVGNIGQNTSITLNDAGYTNEARELTFVLTMRGLYNMTWPVNVNWLSGSAPEIAYGETAIIKLFRVANGEWVGWKVGDAVNSEEVAKEIGIDNNEAPLDNFSGTLHKYVSETIWAPGQEPTKLSSSCTAVALDNVAYGETETITATVPQDATGDVTVTVNNVDYTGAISNGTASVNITDLVPGEYQFEAVYNGDSKYESSETYSGSFTISKADSYCRFDSVTFDTSNNKLTIRTDSTPRDERETSISVQFKIYDENDNIVYSDLGYVTPTNGSNGFVVYLNTENIDNGTYRLNILRSGSAYYNNSESDYEFVHTTARLGG